MPLVAEGPPKRCNGCGDVKLRSEFYARRTKTATYAQSQCKACRATKRSEIGARGELLSPEPFAAWLDEVMRRDGVSMLELAARFDVSERTLREIRKGGRRVGLQIVDRALVADGGVMLRDLYPGLYQ